jgi:phospholipid/cholesterol/gamma-HCH transport system substrate-binding protein
METRPPTIGRILIAVGFAVSCFGLFLFLWIAFGGPVPLKAEGYKVTVPFTEASQLAESADVRISGVSVGRVSRVEGNAEGQAEATLEIDSRYAPIPEDTEAILRQKTLLGETYVELTPGSEESGSLPEGGTLPAAQVSEAVQLDEVFRAFDARTRAAFQGWMQGSAAALKGRGRDFSVAIASLEPFADEAERALRLLDTEELAVRQLVREGGEVFGALAERQGQLRGLIENSNAVFGTTARRNAELADAFEVFPTFLRESRATLTRLEEFAVDSNPVVTALRPAARELAPTARELNELSPELRAFFLALPATIDAAPAGMRATRRLLDDNLPDLLGAELQDWLGPVGAIVEVLRRYRREVTGLANLAAASQGVFFDFGTQESPHYVRTESPLTPEAVAAYPNRLEITRTNPYLKPGGFLDVRTTMGSFETRHCTAGIDAFLTPASSTDPLFLERTDGDLAEGQQFFDRINLFAFNDVLGTTAMTPPPCNAQAALRSVGAPQETSDYLHVRDLPEP